MLSSYEVTHRLGTKSVQWDSRSRILSVGDKHIKFTPKEYRLLFLLRHSTPVAYAELATLLYQAPADRKVRIMIHKHVDRIRGKLRGSGLYIYCVLYYGYLLLPEIEVPTPWYTGMISTVGVHRK